MQLQRELRRRGLLQPVAEQRLNAIGLAWQPQVSAAAYPYNSLDLTLACACRVMRQMQTI